MTNITESLSPPILIGGWGHTYTADMLCSDDGVIYSDCLHDWLSCTLKAHTLKDLVDYFGNDYFILDFSHFGYDKTLIWSTKIKVLYSESDKSRNFLLYLSGYGCREIEQYYDWKSLYKFIKMYDYIDENNIYVKNYNITRLDIAYDFFNTRINLLNYISDKFDSKLIVTKFRKITKTLMVDSSYLQLGHSFRFGSRSSNISIIFYDKFLERKNNDSHMIDESIKSWYRMEINFSDVHANLIFDMIADCQSLDSVSFHIGGIVNNYIDIKNPNGYNRQNLYKASTCDLWVAILNNVNKNKLALKSYQSSIDKKAAWLDRQVLKTIAMIKVVNKMTNTNLLTTLSFKDDIKDSDLAIVNDYLKRKNLDLVNKSQLRDILKTIEF